jgi:hypothetical protein
MSIESPLTPFRQSERRRSERLPFRETIHVCGRSHGHSFKEETLTISISAHGALLPLLANVSLGQKVLLMNPHTWDEREARVVRVGNFEDGRMEVAIEFAIAAPEFWPLPVA